MKNFHSLPLRRVAILLFLLACFTNCFAGLSGSATLTWAQVGTKFNYTITLKNTGTTNIGTFWFAWLPGADYLPTAPSAAAGPAGWSTNIFPGSPGTSIQYVANSGAILPGKSSSAFTFTSTDTPAVILGTSAPSGNKVTTTTIYSGGPFSDAGFVLVVTQGVSASNSFKLNQSTSVGGNAVTGTLSIAQVSTVSTFVPITSDSAAIFVPGGGVTIPAGKTSLPLSFATRGVPTSTNIKLTAKFGSTSIVAPITLKPATLVGFTLSRTILGGGKPTATALFDGLTGSVRSLTVTAAGSPAVAFTSPVSVPAQTKSVPLVILTKGVDATTNATVTLHDGTVALSKPIQVLPATISFITSDGIVGGTRPTLTVAMNGLAGPSGRKFQIVSDHASLITFPAGVILPQQQSARIIPNPTEGVSALVQIDLSVGSLHVGLQYLPAWFQAVNPSATSVVGGQDLNVVAQLHGKCGPTALSVGITSDSSSLTVPKSTTIAPQMTSATFVCHTKAVTKDTTVTVLVTVSGLTLSTKVIVKAPSPARP